MLIKLSNDCYVAADQIAEVKVNDHETAITVRTKDGVGHRHAPAYSENMYTALDRIVAEINAATSNKE